MRRSRPCPEPYGRKIAQVDPRRGVPRTDTVLADPRLADATARLGRERVKAAVACAQQAVREGALAASEVVDAALDALPATATTLRPVLNATGVVLHTNLGRAPLSDAARAALDVAAGTCDVELDLATGERGPRGAGVDRRAARRGARRRGRARGEQRRRRARARRAHAGRRAGRWSSPGASSSRSATGSASRPCWRRPVPGCARWAPPTGSPGPTTRRPIGRGHRVRAQGAPVELRGARVHQRRAGSTSWPVSACPSSPTSGRGCSPRTRCCPTSPTPPPRSRRAPRWSRRPATSCSAARRPGWCSARRARAPRRWPGSGVIRWPGRCGWTSSRWPRWRPRCAARGRPCARFLDADPDSLSRRRRAAGRGAGRRRRRGLRDRGHGGRWRRARRVLASAAVALPERYAAALRAGDPAVLGPPRARALPARPARVPRPSDGRDAGRRADDGHARV